MSREPARISRASRTPDWTRRQQHCGALYRQPSQRRTVPPPTLPRDPLGLPELDLRFTIAELAAIPTPAVETVAGFVLRTVALNRHLIGASG